MSTMIDEYLEALEEAFQEAKDGKDYNASALIEEATELVEQIRVEIVAIPKGPRRMEILEKLQKYDKMIKKQERVALLGLDQEREDNRTQAQVASDSLAILEESRKVLFESEEVAVSTLGELTRQTEVINNSNKNMTMTNEELGYSNKLLTRMGKWWRG